MVRRWADPYITADFIWWKAQEDGLNYAYNGVGNGIVNADKGSMHHPRFKYEPGFKVGAGLKFKYDGWDLYSQYTWFRMNKHGSKSSVARNADGNSNVMGNIAIPSLNSFSYNLGQANASWSLHFNVLDVELGRNFWISKHLTLRPFVGMKFSWNDQKFNVTYKDSIGGFYTGDDVNLKMHMDQLGVGLRTGLDTAWYMCKRLSIFGELALNGLWNRFNSSRKDMLAPTSGTSFNLNHVSNHSHIITPVLEWALGLRFETTFHNDEYMFMMQAGWEQQVWFNQNQFVFMPNTTAGNMNLEGLTVKAGFYF